MYLSPHFTDDEVRCKSFAVTPMAVRERAQWLATLILEPIRAVWGGPLIPISWYRDPAYNEAIFHASEARARAEGRPHGGVARRSQHLTGGAADIQPVSLHALGRLNNVIEELIQAGRLPDLGGYGRYPGWIHLDLEKTVDGKIRRWGGLGPGDEHTP